MDTVGSIKEQDSKDYPPEIKSKKRITEETERLNMGKEPPKTFSNGEISADIRNLCRSVDEVKEMISKLPCGTNTRIIERTSSYGHS